jgi:hypothetical protein
MKIIYCAVLILALSTSFVFAQGMGVKQITEYDPSDALHPFKLISLAIRPPIAILNIFVKGGYYVIDSEPLRRAFDIDYQPFISIDEDY